MLAIPYLQFNGNCREAMQFYHQCFGGTLQLHTLGDSPLSSQMPRSMQKLIVQASLINQQFQIMGSDLVADLRLAISDTVSIYLKCDSKKQFKTLSQQLCYESISTLYKDNNTKHFKDRFGIEWVMVVG